eukprot:CAMPEP_0119344292 /NCGR_PEP_ID=MMETSP1333-20130426/106898_1 /TAXON_ID=418940 /ORGANISM="Scyphosphaera apsteinii, Strain RCC1455" /LENGTH=581 /DNA_ID=CAMNT_0007356729 /DNA_START=40 /DNA_END=1785 /DNA_ORIENTATION=-
MVEDITDMEEVPNVVDMGTAVAAEDIKKMDNLASLASLDIEGTEPLINLMDAGVAVNVDATKIEEVSNVVDMGITVAMQDTRKMDSPTNVGDSNNTSPPLAPALDTPDETLVCSETLLANEQPALLQMPNLDTPPNFIQWLRKRSSRRYLMDRENCRLTMTQPSQASEKAMVGFGVPASNRAAHEGANLQQAGASKAHTCNRAANSGAHLQQLKATLHMRRLTPSCRRIEDNGISKRQLNAVLRRAGIRVKRELQRKHPVQRFQDAVYSASGHTWCRLRRMSTNLRDSHAAQLVREHAWGQLAQEAKHGSAQFIKQRGKQALEESQHRHSIGALVRPLEIWDRDPAHLRDHQAAAIFLDVVLWDLMMACLWNSTSNLTTQGQKRVTVEVVVLWDLMMACLWNSTSNLTTQGQKRVTVEVLQTCYTPCPSSLLWCSMQVLTVFIKSFTGAVACIIVALIFRILFHWANKGLHVQWKRRRVKRLRKLAVVWALNCFYYTGSLWVIVAYARCFTEDATQQMMREWLTTMACSWLLLEPSAILAVVLVPCIFQQRFCQNFMQQINQGLAATTGIDAGELLKTLGL